EVRTFNPSGLPLPDDADAEHPKVRELRELTTWSEGMIWVSPERHGAMTENGRASCRERAETCACAGPARARRAAIAPRAWREGGGGRVCFFFASRGRHTRFSRDWSSDVCSSDLEVRTFNPSGLPLPDDADAEHPKVRELRELTTWSEGMIWVSPERHGAMT